MALSKYQAAYLRPFAITPSDTTRFSSPTTGGIYVGTTGDVVVLLSDETTITFSTVPAGTIIPVIALRVNSTGTTASNLVGLR